MHGLMRVRQLTQDDGHIFCTEDQVQEQASQFIQSVIDVYRDFGFNEIIFKLATRPEKRLGSDELWESAEGSLGKALSGLGLTFEVRPGEGAFYGPKIEFHLKDLYWSYVAMRNPATRLCYARPIRRFLYC